MTDLDKRTDELLADEWEQAGWAWVSNTFREGKMRKNPSWPVVRRLIEPKTEAELDAIYTAWQNTPGLGSFKQFFRFVESYTPAPAPPEPTITEIAATLRAAGHEAMAAKVGTGR